MQLQTAAGSAQLKDHVSNDCTSGNRSRENISHFSQHVSETRRVPAPTQLVPLSGLERRVDSCGRGAGLHS